MYRLDLFYYYNGIRKRKVEVSGNRGVREIGQHTVVGVAGYFAVKPKRDRL